MIATAANFRSWVQMYVRPTIKLVGILAACVYTQSYAASHLTLMSSGLVPLAIDINLISALNNTSLPLKKPLHQLYQLREHKLIWSDGENYNDNAKQLIKTIQQADKYGLDSHDYDAEILLSFYDATSVDSILISKSDIVFSHAYIKLASHIKRGKLNQPYDLFKKDNALLIRLNNAADNNSINAVMNELKPQHIKYEKLVEALNYYKDLKIDYDVIELTQRSYELGDQSKEIPKIRQKLYRFGDLISDDLDSEIFDNELQQAVYHFQVRHGLEADGILGKRTLLELNTPIWNRIQQLEINLARAQLLPDLSTGKHILVNIPAYKLYLYDNHQLTYKSNVVVGKKKHKTPVISSELTKIILSPYWNVPRSITRNEIIPKQQQDPDYLIKNNMRLISTDNQHGDYIDPYSIDWANINPYDLNFRIRQEPGTKNSLGKIKFIFPNHHSVYLHDTPSRGLFASPHRALSHGCIRLEDPFGLAETLLSSTTGWSKYDLLNISKQSRSKSLHLEEPVPIHLTYMTAWVDEHGIVNFRPDIYKQDTNVKANLYNAAL